ncbi:MAG: type II secretion system F family protein [Acidobacteria bacterium]|nr:type II secretion system F family protein [Acidobacteriota bacterium]
MTIVLATFVAILGIIFGAYWFFVLRVDQSDEAALRKRLQPTPKQTALKQSKLLMDVKGLSSMPRLNVLLGSMGRITAPLQRSITQAGMSLTVGTLLLSAACLALFGYFVVRLLTFSTYLGFGAGFLLFFVPFIVVRFKKTKRLRKFEEQFPEAIDLISRALRAGHAFTTGLAMAAEEIPAPVGQEFKLLYDRQNFGMPLPDAMKAFAARIPLIDARFFVTAVLTQRETGGNLGEVLDNLASVIRERFKVKRQVRVLTAHGRITGWILAALPPTLAGAMFVMSPGHMKILTSDTLGIQMIVAALVLQVIGTIIIQKLVNIRY